VKIKCLCCDLPCATIEGGELVIQSKHGSEKHKTSLSVARLERLLDVMRLSAPPAPLRRDGAA
jgi:hypothetical protein